MKDKEKQYISMKEMLTKRSIEPITNCNCKIESRIDYAVRKNEDNTGSMADLLNQEIEELTNQKEIEEMAKVICQQQYFNTHCVEHCNLKGYCCECTDLATNLYNAGYRKLPEDSVSTSQEKVFDILNRMEFFQGQRAGRELWNDKPKEVQDQDIANFVRDINYIRSYLKDSVVLSREELKRLETNYKIGLGKSQSWCKSLKNRIEELEKENFKLKVENEELKGITEQLRQEIITLSQELVNSRKETAEKIYKLVGDYQDSEYLMFNLKTFIKEQLGVEIKE